MLSDTDVTQPSVPVKCLAAQEFDWITFVISVGLAIGIVISYLPQVPKPTSTLTLDSIIVSFIEKAVKESVLGFCF
jgi:hypothetical protein